MFLKTQLWHLTCWPKGKSHCVGVWLAVALLPACGILRSEGSSVRSPEQPGLPACSGLGGGIISPLCYLSGLHRSLIRLRKQPELCLKDNVFSPWMQLQLGALSVYKVLFARRLWGEAVARRQASHHLGSLCPGPEPMCTLPWSSCAHRSHSPDPAHWLRALVGPPCAWHTPSLTPYTQWGPSWTLYHHLAKATDPAGLSSLLCTYPLSWLLGCHSHPAGGYNLLVSKTCVFHPILCGIKELIWCGSHKLSLYDVALFCTHQWSPFTVTKREARRKPPNPSVRSL